MRHPAFKRPLGKPRVEIKVKGTPVPKWTSFRVESNGFSVADSFEVKLPWDVTEKPEQILLASTPTTSSLLVKETNIPVEIWLGFDVPGLPPVPSRRIMYGKMDICRWNFGPDGEYVTLVGRNLAGQLIDTKTTEKYQNRTASQVAAEFFARHGLKPQVTATSTLIGTYLNNNHSNITRETTQWDFLLYLAQQEGFVCRVVDDTGYFGPRSGIANLNAEPIPFTWGVNIDDLEIERGPQAARNIVVEVRSWHNGRRIVEKATTRNHVEEKYIQRFTIPGLTREQAQKRARAILAELSAQEFFGRLRTDWQPEISIDRRIALYGVGQGLSRVYYVNRVTVEGSLDGGTTAEIAFTSTYLTDSGRYG